MELDIDDIDSTPRSGRKKKSYLAKRAKERRSKTEDVATSYDSLRNGNKTSLEDSSLTQVSIDQSFFEESARPVERKSETRTQIVEEKRETPKPVPRNRVRQSFDLSDGHWTKNEDRDSSPLVSSDDDVIVKNDIIEHRAQVHLGEDLRNESMKRNRNISNYSRNAMVESDSDSDAREMRTQYNNIIANKSSPSEPIGHSSEIDDDSVEQAATRLKLTEENLRRKETLDLEREDSVNDLDTSFIRTNRLQRLTNMSRGVAGTPVSEIMGSTKSFGSQSSLPLITTKSVRERSFLVGSIGHSSMLGAEELERMFPDRRIKVSVVTWNMYENKAENLPRCLDDILLPEEIEFVPDLCVVHTQESCSDKREWEIRLQETIGPTHVLYVSAYHGDLNTCVFMRRDLIWYCSTPEWDKTTFRPAVRTKGTLALSFNMFGTSFLFLNSHFTSGDGRLDLRIQDYKDTITRIKLTSNPNNQVYNKESANDVTARFDVTFWGGDMNFRIVRPRHIVDTIVQAIQEHQKHPDYEELLVGCEFYRCKNEGLAFQRFQEGRINFPPSYKYDVNEGHRYDTSEKMRIPSYCDRILFRTKKKHACACLHYSSIDSIKVSDHHPVFGLYEVELRPGKDSARPPTGRFDREVYVEANRRRAEFRANPTAHSSNQKRSSICSVS